MTPAQLDVAHVAALLGFQPDADALAHARAAIAHRGLTESPRLVAAFLCRLYFLDDDRAYDCVGRLGYNPEALFGRRPPRSRA